jgi:hypothetical protein
MFQGLHKRFWLPIRIVVFFTFLLFCNVSSLIAKEVLVSKNSYQKVKPSECKCLVNGQVKFRGPESETFATSSQVNGQFIAEDTTFLYALEINGQAKCKDCLFKDQVLFRGDVSLKNCIFQNDLEVLNNRLDLVGCKAGHIYLTSPKWLSFNPFVKPKVILRKKSIVDFISFSVPGGKVYCYEGSKVLKVRNGSAVQK